MKHLEALMKQQEQDRNPGHELGKFLIGHSNSLEYLIGQLHAYLEAAKADWQIQLEFGQSFSEAVKNMDALCSPKKEET